MMCERGVSMRIRGARRLALPLKSIRSSSSNNSRSSSINRSRKLCTIQKASTTFPPLRSYMIHHQDFSTIVSNSSLQTSHQSDLLSSSSSSSSSHPFDVVNLIQSGSLNIDIYLHDQLSNPHLSFDEFNHIVEAISYSDVGLKVMNNSFSLSRITTINLEKLLNLSILTDSWHHAHTICNELASRNDPASKPYHFIQYILGRKRSSSYTSISHWCDVDNIHYLFQIYSHHNTTLQEVFDLMISSWISTKGLHLLQNLSLFLQLIIQYQAYPHPLSSNELMGQVLRILSTHETQDILLFDMKSSMTSPTPSNPIPIHDLLSNYYQLSFTFLYKNLINNIDNNLLFNNYQKYISTMTFVSNISPQSIEMKSEQSYLFQLLQVYDHDIQPKRNILYLKRDIIRLLSSFQPRKCYISSQLPILLEFSKVLLHDSRYSRHAQDTVDFCIKLMELFIGKIPTEMNWIDKRSATAVALFESIPSPPVVSHRPFETFVNRKYELMNTITKIFEKNIRREEGYSKSRLTGKQKQKTSGGAVRDINQLRSTYYGNVLRAICSDTHDYQATWNRLITTLEEISPTLHYSGGQIGGGSMYSYYAIGGIYSCQYHLSGSRNYEFQTSLSLFTPLSRISNNDISMNHLVLDMAHYLNEEYETLCLRQTLQTIHLYLSKIDYPEALYTQLLLQIQHHTILNTISDLQQYGSYHIPIGTEILHDQIIDRIFCLSFENNERHELLANIQDDLFQQFLMKKLLFRINILIKLLKSDYQLDINNLYDVNKYIDKLNTSLEHHYQQQQQQQQHSSETTGTPSNTSTTSTNTSSTSNLDKNKKHRSNYKKLSKEFNLSQNSLPYQSPQERCMFQVYKYILQILTQIGHPAGAKVTTKYLIELANHSNADIPSIVFSKVIKMNTLAKKYIDIHELTKIMILRNRSLYVDDIFHVISSFLVTKDYPTAYKLMLYAVKQVIIPPPHIFCTLCVTIGTSPILNEKALNIAEKTFQLMLKLYGSCIVYSSYWSSPQDGCLLTSRIQWLMKSKKYDEIKIHLLDCENHIQDTPQRLIDLCEIALTLVPKQEIDLRQDIQQILFRGKDMLHQATLQTSPPSAQLSVESSSLSSRLQNGNEYTPRR